MAELPKALEILLASNIHIYSLGDNCCSRIRVGTIPDSLEHYVIGPADDGVLQLIGRGLVDEESRFRLIQFDHRQDGSLQIGLTEDDSPGVLIDSYSNRAQMPIDLEYQVVELQEVLTR